MRRFILLAAAIACAGCLADRRYSNWPGTDRDRDKVRQAIDPVMKPSFERHICHDGRAADPLAYGMTYSAGGGETHWCNTFAYRTPTGEQRDLTPEEARRILTGVQADMLAAMKKAGVEANWSPPPEVGTEPNPAGSFAIRYLRKSSDGVEISGELIGKLKFCGGTTDKMSQVRVSFNECPCK